MSRGIPAKGIGHDDEKEVGEGHHKTQREADGGFLAMGGDTERDGDKGKCHTGQ